MNGHRVRELSPAVWGSASLVVRRCHAHAKSGARELFLPRWAEAALP